MKISLIVFGLVCGLLTLFVAALIVVGNYPINMGLVGLGGLLMLFSFVYGGYLYFKKRRDKVRI